MTLNLLKNLMLWLAIASYSAQAVLGGTGLAICLGQHVGSGTGSAQPVVVESHCNHAGCGDQQIVQIVPEHEEDDACPCTDISIEDSEPGRVEDQAKLVFSTALTAIAIDAFRPDSVPPADVIWPPNNADVMTSPAPLVVRTVVLLI